MSRNYNIKGDTVTFENVYGAKNIKLKHHTDGYSLQFDSKCIFKQGIDAGHIEYTEVTLGNYTISVHGGDLTFKKNGDVLMTLNKPPAEE